MHHFNLKKFETSAFGLLTAFKIVALTGFLSFAAILPARTATVSFVNPPAGSTAGGTRVVLIGSGFDRGTRVLFYPGPTEAQIDTVHSSTLMSIIIPPRAAGPVNLRIDSGPLLSGLFTYIDNAFSNAVDTDGDGLNDAAELALSLLGFDYQVAQPGLVASFLSGNELLTPAQVQALNVGTPLIRKDQATGKFKMTIGMKKSTNLVTVPFSDFPMNGPGMNTSVNAEGKLDFEFTAPDNAAFFSLWINPPPQRLAFSSAVADFQQGAPFVIANSLLPNAEGWGVFGGVQAARTGYFLFVGPASGDVLEVTMHQNFGERHWIQQFQIAVTTDAVPNTAGGGNWTTWVPTTFASSSTTLSLVGGTSIRSTGTNATASYTLRGAFPVQGITAVRLTCSPHDYDTGDALPATVGRSPNGNFVLSEFKAAAYLP